MNDHFLLHVYPVILIGVFVVWATLLRLSWSSIAYPFQKILSVRGWAAVLSLMSVFLVARLFVVPPRHQVYFDEFIHEDVAENVAHDGTFGETLASGPDGRRLAQVTAWPGGYHVLLGSVFKVFGFSESAAFRFNIALGTASLLLVFLLAALLFKDQRAGMLAAFFLAALPAHFRFSGAADLTACSEFWILTALLTFALHLEIQTLTSYVLFLLSLVYASHVRVENVILIPFTAIVLMIDSRARRETARDGYLAVSSMALLLLAPIFAVVWHNRTSGLDAYSASFAAIFSSLIRNGAANCGYLLGSPFVSLALLPLAILGLARLPAQMRKTSIALLILAFAYVALCSMHARAVFSAGAYVRLAVPALLLIVVAASGGLASLRSARRCNHPAFIAAACVLFVAMCWPAYGRGPLPRYEDEYRLVKTAQALLPSDALVITFCPALIIVGAERQAIAPIGLSGGFTDLETRLRTKNAEHAVLFKDVWWYKFADASSAVEKALLARYRFQRITTAQIDSHEYGFYRLIPL